MVASFGLNYVKIELLACCVKGGFMPSLFTLESTPNALHVKCFGDWTHANVSTVLKHSFKTPHKKIIFKLNGINSMDTAGAMALLHVKSYFESRGKHFEMEGASSLTQGLLNLCIEYSAPRNKPNFKAKKFDDSLVFVGKMVEGYWFTFMAFMSFVGGAVSTFLKSSLQPKSIRFKATLYHMEHNGMYALPIIAITTLLVGVVIAYQGAVQLEKFGANIFIVEMVGIAATRELAPLIVAIVIAGRSASAFTAQIGVMKITEEVDAMRTMGFGPWEFLVLPRVVALIVSMPLLVLFGDGVAILGGMIVAQAELGVSMSEFLARFQETVALKHTVIGLVKAPFFGAIIALIGCYRGFQISSSTESVGHYTTVSVVNAIFWVIAFNALFSVLLTELGW